MADLKNEEEGIPSKEVPSEDTKTYSADSTTRDGDLEHGDKGILVKSAPLAKQLQGRHMQMIAIGTRFQDPDRRNMS